MPVSEMFPAFRGQQKGLIEPPFSQAPPVHRYGNYDVHRLRLPEELKRLVQELTQWARQLGFAFVLETVDDINKRSVINEGSSRFAERRWSFQATPAEVVIAAAASEHYAAARAKWGFQRYHPLQALPAKVRLQPLKRIRQTRPTGLRLCRWRRQ